MARPGLSDPRRFKEANIMHRFFFAFVLEEGLEIT